MMHDETVQLQYRHHLLPAAFWLLDDGCQFLKIQLEAATAESDINYKYNKQRTRTQTHPLWLVLSRPIAVDRLSLL